MNHFAKMMVLAIGLLSTSVATAATPTEQLGTCLVDSLNGKERKQLAKWIYFAIGSHPEINQYLKATPNDVDTSDKYVGELITKLLTVNCPKELVAANKVDPLAIQKAFELVGQVAMQELMTNPATMKALTNYANYADQAKVNELLSK
ncbi:hypothetical protein HR060_05300 [Catenovulum sp. SM1970]|uniref:hypothetical protein n=1 Tax=Marinifaba aquimaris TaxID=2741323 RepID=UPI0015726271|nr:hypothetical protein [Marinifaba aquimaris]NTS76279.1 hypothetical protein [Marinifaba aquimaris]